MSSGTVKFATIKIKKNTSSSNLFNAVNFNAVNFNNAVIDNSDATNKPLPFDEGAKPLINNGKIEDKRAALIKKAEIQTRNRNIEEIKKGYDEATHVFLLPDWLPFRDKINAALDYGFSPKEKLQENRKYADKLIVKMKLSEEFSINTNNEESKKNKKPEIPAFFKIFSNNEEKPFDLNARLSGNPYTEVRIRNTHGISEAIEKYNSSYDDKKPSTKLSSPSILQVFANKVKSLFHTS